MTMKTIIALSLLALSAAKLDVATEVVQETEPVQHPAEMLKAEFQRVLGKDDAGRDLYSCCKWKCPDKPKPPAPPRSKGMMSGSKKSGAGYGSYAGSYYGSGYDSGYYRRRTEEQDKEETADEADEQNERQLRGGYGYGYGGGYGYGDGYGYGGGYGYGDGYMHGGGYGYGYGYDDECYWDCSGCGVGPGPGLPGPGLPGPGLPGPGYQCFPTMTSPNACGCTCCGVLPPPPKPKPKPKPCPYRSKGMMGGYGYDDDCYDYRSKGMSRRAKETTIEQGERALPGKGWGGGWDGPFITCACDCKAPDPPRYRSKGMM